MTTVAVATQSQTSTSAMVPSDKLAKHQSEIEPSLEIGPEDQRNNPTLVFKTV
jgi:hypothetical protein